MDPLYLKPAWSRANAVLLANDGQRYRNYIEKDPATGAPVQAGKGSAPSVDERSRSCWA